MNFLHPLLWLGALAIAAPIWLHLRRKPEKDVHLFSALRFLDDEPVPRETPQQLRDVLMFLLRALAVVLIAGAFAWPYLRGNQPLEVTASRVYILDNTLSNQAGNTFQQGRDAIIGAIGKADGSTQIAVVELTRQPRAIVNFSDTRAQAVATLQALQPSHQRGAFLAAFNQANALLAQSLGQKKQIIIYSDSQENQWSENVNTPPFLKNVEVTVAQPPEVKELPNLALQQPQAARFFVGDKAIIHFNVLLRHWGEQKTATVTLRANRQEILHRDVQLTGDRGDSHLVAQWESDPALWIEGEAEVTGTPDSLPGDNHTYFALPPINEGHVALLSQSTYLRAALTPEVMRGHWTARVLQPSKLAAEVSSPAMDDVLIVEAAYLQSKDARDLVYRYLNDGRGVLLLVNRVTPLVRGMLSSLGFEAAGADTPDGASNGAPAPDAVPDSSGAAAPDAAYIRYIALEHPVFAPFMESDLGDLSAVKVTQHAKITSKTALPLIYSGDGDGLLFEATQTKGRLIVSAFGFDRGATDWPVQTTFIPFLDSLLHYARGLKEMQTTFEPGEIYPMEIPAGDAAPKQVVLRNNGNPVATFAVDANRRAQITIPDEPGVYSITYDASPAVRSMIAVNPPPKESELSYTADPGAIKAWQVQDSGAKKAAPAPMTFDTSARIAALKQRFWWTLLCIAAAALGIEMIWLLFRKARVTV
ncbi:MAG TPA: BatA and WFA domain-containing protein [Chthoniobacteraceae bacterium]|nr:BatA and WFA domain-containing protein [Chthoniobacteraceae bacterium]